MLVALSIGPYHNGDTSMGIDAVMGVMKYGLPYANGLYLMDQPPLGFYIQAASSKGLAYRLTMALSGDFVWTWMRCFSLLAIGKAVYNKTTGFFAASLFAFSPWHHSAFQNIPN